MISRPFRRHTFLPSGWISRWISRFPSSSGPPPFSWNQASGGRPVKTALTRADLAPCPNQIPAGSLSDDGADGIHYNGLAGSRFPRQSVESLVELNVRRFDDCDILNVQQ